MAARYSQAAAAVGLLVYGVQIMGERHTNARMCWRFVTTRICSERVWVRNELCWILPPWRVCVSIRICFFDRLLSLAHEYLLRWNLQLISMGSPNSYEITKFPFDNLEFLNWLNFLWRYWKQKNSSNFNCNYCLIKINI